MKYEIVDNFLDSYYYKQYYNHFILNKNFPFYLTQDVGTTGANDGIMFYHKFISKNIWNVTQNKKEEILSLLEPICNKLNINKLLRLQVNLYPKSNFFRVNHKFHIDFNYKHKGCIYYLNTNNGETIIKNSPFNIRVKSVKNRALLFDPSDLHKSTTCTDANFRANIIFNYL